MNSKILKSTARGQITLPLEWRSNFSTDNYIVEMQDNNLLIRPLFIHSTSDETILFDADTDNDGVGISPEEMIQMLNDIKHGSN